MDCGNCTLNNTAEFNNCEACDVQKPGLDSTLSSLKTLIEFSQLSQEDAETLLKQCNGNLEEAMESHLDLKPI